MSKGIHFVRLVLVLVVIVLASITIIAAQTEDYRLTMDKYEYDPVLDLTTYHYTFSQSGGVTDISHLVLGICVVPGRYNQVSGWTPVLDHRVIPDPTTGQLGIKLDRLTGETFSFSLVMNGKFSDSSLLNWTWKAGKETGTFQVIGPVCGINAVSLSTELEAESNPPIALVVLLTVLVFVSVGFGLRLLHLKLVRR